MAELKQRRRKRPPPSPRTASPRSRRKVIAILSRKRSLYSTRRLVEAATIRGHRAIVLDTLRCTLVLVPHAPRIIYRGVELRGIQVAIPRIGASITGYGIQVVNHLDMMGVPVLASSGSIARSRDKLRCLQLLSRFGVDIPRTVMAHDRSNVARLVEEVGGLPAIIKLLRGTQGVGVMLASSMAEVQSALNTFWQLGHEIFLQEFVRESEGRDVRALVVGDRVVGAMRRTAKKGEFRSNLHRGGEGTPIELPKAYADAAVKAARIIGLEIAGVDMLESATGPKIMEVNSSPGFRGLEEATRKDIAGWIIEHAVSIAEAQGAPSKQQIS
ncbi:MAG TPA: RimK family alpha-L-glutamate ligase [Myxococcaceae bacterium]|nr:RimK family alpha-L-glutamate ligase [Myxococcaceae bacterium]